LHAFELDLENFYQLDFQNKAKFIQEDIEIRYESLRDTLEELKQSYFDQFDKTEGEIHQ
jgi:FAD/FMN-containing dehydrogenase